MLAYSRLSFLLRLVLAILVPLGAALWLTAEAFSAEVQLKDGRVLQGKFVKVSSTAGPQSDSGGIPIPEKILLNDNGLKRTYVPDREVREVIPGGGQKLEKIRLWQRIPPHLPSQVNNVGAIVSITPFDEHGRRTFTLATTEGKLPVIQGITEITPIYTRVQGIQHRWDMRIATSSLPPKVLRKILATAIQDDDPQQRMSLARLYIQTRQYGQAKEELDSIVKDFPAFQERVAPVARSLTQLRARQILQEIEVRTAAGQQRLVRAILEQFPVEGVSGDILRQVRDNARKLQQQEQRSELAWNRFHALLPRLSSENQERVLPIRDEIFARRSQFVGADFPNARRFCSRLADQWMEQQEGPEGLSMLPSPGRRLAELFSEDAQAAVVRVATTGHIAPVDGRLILAELNAVLREPTLYRAVDFGMVVLPEEAKESLKIGVNNLSQASLIRLNRLVLEAAYEDIEPSTFQGLTPTGMVRLEAFLQFAAGANAAAGPANGVPAAEVPAAEVPAAKVPAAGGLNPSQLVALAISGWLVGSNSAETNLAVALSLYRTRNLVRAYLTSRSEIERRKLLTQIRQEEAGSTEVVAKLLANMAPPLETPPQQDEGFYELRLDTVRDQPPIRYFVQLPPEYDPYARYPIIVSLHGLATVPANSVQRPPKHPRPSQIDWWKAQAARHGYIVMAPAWATAQQREYGYSSREHAAVLATLRDACRRFAIDTDRVFLQGHDIGGDAAWDIGLAHPDLWAGVIPIVGKSDKYCAKYWPNAKLVPFYCVGGELDADLTLHNSREYDRLMKHYADLTVVEYRGRGHEHFAEDILDLFDWMKRRKRDFYPPEFEVRSMRPWDNFFWWLEVKQLPRLSQVQPFEYDEKGPRTRAARLEAKKLQGNGLRVSGSNAVTIWLSPELVDFNERVELFVGTRSSVRRTVNPDLAVLLEDARTRADRQHPFWARVDIP